MKKYSKVIILVAITIIVAVIGIIIGDKISYKNFVDRYSDENVILYKKVVYKPEQEGTLCELGEVDLNKYFEDETDKITIDSSIYAHEFKYNEDLLLNIWEYSYEDGEYVRIEGNGQHYTDSVEHNKKLTIELEKNASGKYLFEVIGTEKDISWDVYVAVGEK